MVKNGFVGFLFSVVWADSLLEYGVGGSYVGEGRTGACVTRVASSPAVPGPVSRAQLTRQRSFSRKHPKDGKTHLWETNSRGFFSLPNHCFSTCLFATRERETFFQVKGIPHACYPPLLPPLSWYCLVSTLGPFFGFALISKDFGIFLNSPKRRDLRNISFIEVVWYFPPDSRVHSQMPFRFHFVLVFTYLLNLFLNQLPTDLSFVSTWTSNASGRVCFFPKSSSFSQGRNFQNGLLREHLIKNENSFFVPRERFFLSAEFFWIPRKKTKEYSKMFVFNFVECTLRICPFLRGRDLAFEHREVFLKVCFDVDDDVCWWRREEK